MKRISTDGVTSTLSLIYVVQPSFIGRYMFFGSDIPITVGAPSGIRSATIESLITWRSGVPSD